MRIQFFMPYPEMHDDINAVLKEFRSKYRIQSVFTETTKGFHELMPNLIDYTVDAIVARSATAHIISRFVSSIPVFRMDFTAAEIIVALMNCQKMFNSRKIGVVGASPLSHTAGIVSQISGIPFASYDFDEDAKDLEHIYEKIKDSDCDALIGGRTSIILSELMGIKGLQIRTSRETLWNVINNAVCTVSLRRNDQSRIDLMHTIIKNSKEGSIFIDNHGIIRIMNSISEDIFHAADIYIGKHYAVLGIKMKKFIKEALKNTANRTEILIQIHGSMFSAESFPIKAGETVYGMLVYLSNVETIQDMEQKIRKNLYAKGMKTRYTFQDILHQSEAMAACIGTAKKFCQVEANVLVYGETGTGKEVLAQSMHAHSPRKNEPFVAINCAAMPEQLLESELFGYVEGAFTGAAAQGKAGLFELAHNGTLFLDEISEVPLSFQSKLLRVLQEREIRRIGADRVLPVNVRIIAASNRDIRCMVEEGQFRKDLYFRLDVLRIFIPPLRLRPGDTSLLFQRFFHNFQTQFGKRHSLLSPEALDLLERQPWPGNIRELQNTATRLAVLADAETVTPNIIQHVLESVSQPQNNALGQDEVEKARLISALKQTNSRQETAFRLGISRATLWRKLKKYNLTSVVKQ
jgi:Transcriptional regulator containing PAS, AAA-type ATPase, and DNA-binding domains